MSTATTSPNGTQTAADKAAERALKEAKRLANETAKDGGTPGQAIVPQMTIPRLTRTRMVVPIIGTAPLLTHRFSEKAKQQMLDAQTGNKQPKAHRDPEADYQGAFYKFAKDHEGDPDRYGFPVIAFKSAIVDSARFYGKTVTKVLLRQAVFVIGTLGADDVQLVEIDGTPFNKEDVVRVGQGGSDLRYRPQFNEWKTTLTIEFVDAVLNAESVLSLLAAAGFSTGIGEWRPEKGGTNGTFEVDENRELVIITGV